MKTPEERFDDALHGENYKIFLWVVLFLFSGIQCFIGLMPQGICIGVAATLMFLWMTITLAPLVLEANREGRMRRRIDRAFFFPVDKKSFVISKIKKAMYYGGIFWLVSLGLQVIASPLFGVKNILLYQATLLAAGVINALCFIVFTTIGGGKRE